MREQGTAVNSTPATTTTKPVWRQEESFGNTPSAVRVKDLPKRAVIFSWVVGAAALAAVVIAATHFREGEEFIGFVWRAAPGWLLVAAALQASTYFAEATLWKTIIRSAGLTIPIWTAFRLSLAKLFVDQALPSVGISGAVLVANSFERSGLPRRVVMAGVLVDLAAFNAAYVLALSAAMAIAASRGAASSPVVALWVVFSICGIGLPLVILAFARGGAWIHRSRLRRFHWIDYIFRLIETADPQLVRNGRNLVAATACHLAIFCLDAGTVWVLVRALGGDLPIGRVFASYMVASVFRAIGIIPGGLGTFEGASVVMLKLSGAALPVALAATLMFRGLSFWLPMLPGLIFSRNLLKRPARSDLGVGPRAFQNDNFWAEPLDSLLRGLRASPSGLTTSEAASRLRQYGVNTLKKRRRADSLTLALAQFKSPIVLILLCAAGVSFFLRDPVDAGIIMVIVLLSAFLGFWQEKSAANAVATLLQLVQVKAAVLRDGQEVEEPVEKVVPGDCVILNAGDIVPGDGRILESKDLFVEEASLTGETFPVEKAAGELPEDTPLAKRTNAVFLGTHVVSGTGKIVIARTGAQTEFGRISERLRAPHGEAEFERGVRRFGYLLMEVTLLLALGIFALNVYFARPVLESLLFVLALAVGLTPQLLPAIIAVNLAHGAKRMAAQRVIVKRLAAIENFGSMTVLCSDKTGTLTEGQVQLASALDLDGGPSERVLAYAVLNAGFQKGYSNPMDAAILARQTPDRENWRRLDEEPYDFTRRRISILVADSRRHLVVTKGAVQSVLAACACAETQGGRLVELSAVRERIEDQLRIHSEKGLRVLAVAYKEAGSQTRITKGDESEMVFLGLLTFHDPLRPGIAATLHDLASAGIALKIITGDNRLVAQEISRQAGLANVRLITGTEIRATSDAALLHRVNAANVFAEIEPNQKERIILALRKSGQIVGYVGDGINDASALHAADIGISVAGAADVARDAADIVLLDKDLAVLERGVREGRTTFANTLKYIFMATSANFGNMLSMAGASLLVPFLPLLPKQILLVNLLTDLPEMTIATDRVEEEWVRHPRRWDFKFIRRFMITFGLLSSLFDFATFAILLLVVGSTPAQFRSGWFVESVVSASLIVLIVRSPRPVWSSRPSRSLLLATIGVVVTALMFPFLPFASALGFSGLPLRVFALLVAIVFLYVSAAEWMKRVFYRRVSLG